jgi:hypothetical protein
LANKAREALSKLEGVDSVVVDTTARAIIRMKDDAKPDEKAMNEALPRGMKARKLQKQKMDVATAIYKIKIDGMS